MEMVNYLGVTFNLSCKTCKPYTNPNNQINYIHYSRLKQDSNYPPSFIHKIPLSTESRLSTLSYNEKIFQEALTTYQKHCKTLVINSPSPINSTITIVPTQIKENEIKNNNGSFHHST